MSMNQTVILLKIYQGESRRVSDNLQLGELEVTGIPPGPPGQQIVVRFTYDLNGLLEVESFIPETGKRFQVILNQHASGLTPQQVREAVERLQQLKFYPRDRLENRRLVLFCERLVGEVAPHERETLEAVLDQFELGLSSGRRELYAETRANLLRTLADLGFSTTDFEEDHHAP
jgi:molecular chaperone HscC